MQQYLNKVSWSTKTKFQSNEVKREAEDHNES